MQYLIDANVLITAKNEYYEFGRVDEYWEWLASQANGGHAKMPHEIYEEIMRGNDELATWARQHRNALLLEESVDDNHLQQVLNEGYAPDLNQNQIETLGYDPHLIAYAFAVQDNRTVVTLEVQTGRQRQNRRIPDVCTTLHVNWCDPWDFGRALDFRTTWNRP